MKKNLIHIVLVALFAVFAFPLQADAQLGGLLKKVKKGVENVTKATGVSADAKAAGTEVAIPSGGTMINPFAEAMDVELVGCYGKSTSENYGTAYLVLKLKMKLNKTSVLLSGNENGNKTMAVDADGNAYQTSAMGGTRRDRGHFCQGKDRRPAAAVCGREEVCQGVPARQAVRVHRSATSWRHYL